MRTLYVLRHAKSSWPDATTSARGLRLTRGVSGGTASQMCSLSAWLRRDAVHGSASGERVAWRRGHRCEGGRACASIVGAKQKGNEPPPSDAPVTDVALSPSPQKKTTRGAGVSITRVPAARSNADANHMR
jgi:hypothetical protein